MSNDIQPTRRTTNPRMETRLGNPIKVLDHGFVRLVDYMGSDESIVQAARVSYGKGTKKSSEDRGLIRFLMRHRHTTPLEMCEIKLHCKMPIFVARQWIRHRTANVNEYSARYSEMHDEFYNPAEEHVTGQNPKHRQARGSELPENVPGDFRSLAARTYSQAWIAYQEALDKGVAREIARSVLPVANYTEWYWKIDLHNLFHFLSLRLHSHAQYEIRVYAEAIARIVRDWVPHAWEAFEDYRLNGMFLSGPEVKVLKTLTNDPGFSGEGRPAFEMSILEHHGLSKREAREFCSKLEFELIE